MQRELSRRWLALYALFASLLLLATFTACGGNDQQPEVAATQQVPTQQPSSSLPEATAGSDEPTVATSAEPTSEEQSVAADEPTDSESAKPPVLSKEASGRDLTLADFFAAPDEWRDGRFDIAGQKNVTGIGGELSYCQEDQDEDHPTLELRLANNFSKISMKVGQNDLSQSSDAVLNVQLKGNGKYIDSTRVPFNKVDTFSASVADVNALKIEVWMGGEMCQEPIGAVITGLRVE